ncbi:MAG: ribonuclease H family protein [Bacillota bacterium]
MKMFVFKMKIIDKQEESYLIQIKRDHQTTEIMFTPETKKLQYCGQNEVAELLQEHEHQLKKVLHTKRPDSYYVGFELTFSFRYDKDVVGFNNKDKLVVLDKRAAENKSYIKDNYEADFPKIYTDGSFLEKFNTGAYAVIIKTADQDYDYYTQQVEVKNSGLIELLAAMKGVELLENQNKLRLITDSQYVRKGLTEWIVNWKLNNWRTVNGDKVKNIEYWKKFDQLTAGKYIEFAWVEAHSDHFENELCDLMAKETALNS